MAESVRSPDVRRRRCSRLGQLETLQRDTSKVSVRLNSIFHSSRLTTTTSNYHRHSADIAGDPEPLTSLPASEPELTSWSRQEVLVGVGDPGARRRRGGGHVERGPPWCGRSRNGCGLSGRRKKTEERIRRRRPAAVSLRSAVARESAAATARRPPSAPPCRHPRKRPAGRRRSRHRRKSKPPLVPLGVAAAGRRRGRDPTAWTTTTVACVMLQWQLCWLTSTTEQA